MLRFVFDSEYSLSQCVQEHTESKLNPSNKSIQRLTGIKGK
jgi:hypothetical protein